MSKLSPVSRLLPVVLVATTLLLSQAERPPAVVAQTCTVPNCGPRPLQFVPGQRIRLEIINRTSSLVRLEKVFNTDAFPLLPGQQVDLDMGGGTEPNISLVFWDETALPLRTTLSKPNTRTLRVEIYPGGRPPGDRSVYVRDDGRVAIF